MAREAGQKDKDWPDKDWNDKDWKDDSNWKDKDWKDDSDWKKKDWKAKDWKDDQDWKKKDWGEDKDEKQQDRRDWKGKSWNTKDWKGEEARDGKKMPELPGGAFPTTLGNSDWTQSAQPEGWSVPPVPMQAAFEMLAQAAMGLGMPDPSAMGADGTWDAANSQWPGVGSTPAPDAAGYDWGAAKNATREQDGDNGEWKDRDRRRDKGDGKGRDGKGRDKKDKKEKKDKKKKLAEMPEKLFGDCWEEPKETAGLMVVSEMAPNYRWEYPFWDESRRSFAGFLKSPWNRQQCGEFYDEIRAGTEWLQPETSKGVMPRKTAWLVNKGCSCEYSYGPFQVPPAEFPPWMLNLLGEVMPKCGLQSDSDWPDCCNMNLYDDGGAAVGWHADDESLFQGKFRDILIISLSFGVTRKFELRYNWPGEGEDDVHRFLLGSGDLMTMEGMTQKHMQHRVPKEDWVQGPRINLTWRWIIKHTPQCSATRCRR